MTNTIQQTRPTGHGSFPGLHKRVRDDRKAPLAILILQGVSFRQRITGIYIREAVRPEYEKTKYETADFTDIFCLRGIQNITERGISL
jgi:hypothetical protein